MLISTFASDAAKDLLVSEAAISCTVARKSSLGSVPQPKRVFLGPLAGCERTVGRQDARARTIREARSIMLIMYMIALDVVMWYLIQIKCGPKNVVVNYCSSRVVIKRSFSRVVD